MSPFVLLRVCTRPFESLVPLHGAAACRTAVERLDLEEERSARAERLAAALFEAAGDPSPPGDGARARGRLAIVALRRSVHNDRPPRAADVEAARAWISPDLHRRLLAHEEERRRADAARRAFAAAYEADLHAGRRAVAAAVVDPLVAEGIRLSSRSLLEAVRDLGRREPAAWGHGEKHAGAKAAAYLARFATKTSPNGLFCATAPVEVVSGPLAVAGAPTIDRTEILLNVHESRKIAACLAAQPELRPAVVPRPNPTLRRREEAWTFWKPASSRNPDEDEVLSRVKVHPVVERFLEQAARGVLDPVALVAGVASAVDYPVAEIESFYGSLVERGILIAEVEFPYNDRSPLATLLGAARAARCEAPWVGVVSGVVEAIDRLPPPGGPGRIETMDGIVRSLESLPHVRPLKHDEVFRVDAASALEVRLPSMLLDDLRAAVSLYARLFAALYPEPLHRATLAGRFLRLHPSDVDVDLLDLYHGAFEPSEKERPTAFPDPLRLAPKSPESIAASRALARARDLFARRALAAGPGEEISFSEEDLLDIAGGAPEPRWTCGVLFQIAARSASDVEAGRHRLVLSGIFQGTGLALARFARLHGGEDLDRNPIVADLRRGWSSLRREGAILAEITYNHGARTANAGLRPSIFRHEIELPGETASPGATAIPLRDLVVRWDSAEKRFVIRWPARGVEVLPVISCGVNPVGFVSFLTDVGQQGIQPLGLFSGFEAEQVRHWPRVVSGRTVIFRERWALPPEEWPGAQHGGGGSHGRGGAHSDGEFFFEVARWRRRQAIPRHVFVHTSEDPKPRYVDLESPIFVDLLRRALPRPGTGARAELGVTEMLPGPEDLWIAGDGGSYASEFLVHMHQPEPGADAGLQEAAG